MRSLLHFTTAMVLVGAGGAGALAAEPSASPPPTPPPGVIAVIDVPFSPSGLAASDDRIWAEDHADTDRIYVVDPTTGATETSIGVSRPCDVVAGFDRMWAADLVAGKLLEIDPIAKAVVRETPGLHGPCGVQAVDDAVWFVVDEGLGRLDPVTGEVTTTELGGGAFPGAGSPLWAAMYRSGDLVRIDPVSGEATEPIPHPGGPQEGPALTSAHGSLWVGDRAGAVHRLDPESGALEVTIQTAPPGRLLATDTGVWLTSYDGDMVQRIDPATNEVVFSVTIAGDPNGIASGFGSIWVATTGSGLLYRLDPEATSPAP